MRILSELRDRFRSALLELVDGEVDSLVAMIRPAQDAKFGDYQANCAMPLGKRLGKPPREIAEQILQKLDLEDLCLAPEIAGPGFINLRLKDSWLQSQLHRACGDARLGVDPVASPMTYIVDFSSPNVAKTDACGSHPFDRHRRRHLSDPQVPRAPGDCGQPPG